ncbi:MAG TPA: Uma2 family endonuclease [Thermoanaerobaculia bacterium]|nr:Uma2 family endonuclease [Thermoanaerobaculia bacterium]
MAEPIRRPAGWQDILAAPEGLKAEVLGGELILHPRPQPPHGLTQAALSGELSHPCYRGIGGPGGWWFVIEPDVAFGAHDIVAPDLAGWRKTRMPRFPTERPIHVVPDWVCEVLSPSSLRRDRAVKADLYLRPEVPTTGWWTPRGASSKPSRPGRAAGFGWGRGSLVSVP